MNSLNSGNESGKVFVKGKAVGKYTCDMVSITIKFCCKGISGAEASKSVFAQCELFLQLLAENGVDLATLRLQEDRIGQPSYRDEVTVQAFRTIQFDSKAKAAAIGLVLKIIQEEHLDADVSTDYYLSNEEDLRKRLRELAIADSKENADLLARAAGKTISGVDMIDMGAHRLREKLAKSVTVCSDIDCIFELFSDKLSMPTKDLEEEVEVTWLLA